MVLTRRILKHHQHLDVVFGSGGALKPDFGFLAFSGIARLTWLVDLFGELSVAAAAVGEEPNSCRLTVKLLTAANR